MHFLEILTLAFSFGIVMAESETPNKPHGKEVVCQIFTQAYLNEQKNPFDFDVAPWNLCTHVISVDKTNPWDSTNQLSDHDYKKLTSLRNKYPHLKVSSGVPHHKLHSPNLGKEKRQSLAQNYYDFVKTHGFDGINLQRDLDVIFSCDKVMVETFDLFVKVFREIFDQSNLLLAVTISMSNYTDITTCGLASLSESVHFINFVFEYTSSGDKYSYEITDAEQSLGITNFQDQIESLIQLGVSPSKIVAGIHFTGPGFEKNLLGEYSKFESEFKYLSICKENLDIMWLWKKSSGKSNLAIYYSDGGKYKIVIESGRSIANKVRFAMKRGLIGILAVNMPSDDIFGKCNSEYDTFWDFKPDNGIILKIPMQSGFEFHFLHTINDAIHITLDEMAQEAKILGMTEIATSTIPSTAIITASTAMITETTVLLAETSTCEKTSDVPDPVDYGSQLVDTVLQGISGDSNEFSNPSSGVGTGAAHHFIDSECCMTLTLLGTLISILF